MDYRYDDIPKPNLQDFQVMIDGSGMTNKSYTGVTWDRDEDSAIQGTLTVSYDEELTLMDRDVLDGLANNLRGGQRVQLFPEKTGTDDDDLVLIEDSQGGFVKKKVKVSNLPVISDSRNQAEKAESLGESSTSSEVFVQKLRLTFTPVRTGWFEISFEAELKGNKNGAVAVMGIAVDDTTNLRRMDLAETKYMGVGGKVFYEFTDTNEHFIDLDYAVEDNSGNRSAYIRQARLSLREMS